ncbi:hypothetical protein Dimus_029652 [Dionaea muscipula]
MMMNISMKSTLTNHCFPQKLAAVAVAALFHSTPVLDRRRRSHWDTRNNHARRSRKQQWKQNLLRNVSSYAEQLLHSWQCDFDPDDQPFHRGPSWFRRQEWDNGSKRDRSYNLGGHSRGKRRLHFCEDDDIEFETVFQSSFGGNRFFFYSFVEEEPHWRSGSGSKSWNRRYESEEEFDSLDSSGSDLASQRLALGLNASGPLKLEDLKNAYRACALKWHPDRHHGPAKDAAEEKFKLCSAAYQSLCDKLEIA